MIKCLMLSLTLALTCLLSFVSYSSRADSHTADSESNQIFDPVVENIRLSCDTVQGGCAPDSPFAARMMRGKALQNSLEFTNLEKKSIALGANWKDFFSGAFVLQSPVRLDRVIVYTMRSAQNVVAYHLTYSAAALQTLGSNCEGMHSRLSRRHDCSEGRIQESSFVSPDLKSDAHSEADSARFFVGAQ